jgi:transcriptional regulator with XRE-family HTH domain
MANYHIAIKMSRKKLYSDRLKRLYKETGDRFKKVRISLGLSQQEFAQSLGTTQSWVSEIETGFKQPSDTLLIAIQYRYKVNRKWILFGQGEMFEEPPEFFKVNEGLNDISEKILILLKDMPEEARREILRSLEEKKLLQELMEERRKMKEVG